MAQMENLHKKKKKRGDSSTSSDTTTTTSDNFEDDPVVLAQNVIDAIDSLDAELKDLIAKEDNFDTILVELEKLRETIKDAHEVCFPEYKGPQSAVLEESDLVNQPSSAVLDEAPADIGEDSYQVSQYSSEGKP